MKIHDMALQRPPQPTTCPSDVQSDTPLGIALGKLAIAASDYYQALMDTEVRGPRNWSTTRAKVLACALAVGSAVEHEVRQMADHQRKWPVARTGDTAMH